jgi:Flp pilus assembly protein TadG
MTNLGGRRVGERGSAAVEAAIVTPLVMALLFGIVELGFVFKDYLAVTGAVRAGARIASAMPRNSTFSQVAADTVAATGGAMNFKNVKQLWVYKVDPTTDKPVGFTDFSNCTVCVKFQWDAGTKAFVLTSDNWPATSQSACTGAAGPPERIGVYLKLKHDAFTKFVFGTINIAEGSILTFEPLPNGGGCKP